MLSTQKSNNQSSSILSGMNTLPSILAHPFEISNKYKKPYHCKIRCVSLAHLVLLHLRNTCAATARRISSPCPFTFYYLRDPGNDISLTYAYTEWLPKSANSTWPLRHNTTATPFTLHVLWNSNELARLYIFVRSNAILTKRMDRQLRQ